MMKWLTVSGSFDFFPSFLPCFDHFQFFLKINHQGESFERMVSNTMMTYPTLAELDASILASVTDMSGCDGVQGMYFMQLLGMLTCDFSPHVSAALSEHFYKRDKSLVTWSHFHQAVKSCLRFDFDFDLIWFLYMLP
eukprot:m.74676 g.74676  ORF g.74676 m.74676 type:complete len:137 (-) comp8457_c0_seq15:496-906(-)